MPYILLSKWNWLVWLSQSCSWRQVCTSLYMRALRCKNRGSQIPLECSDGVESWHCLTLTTFLAAGCNFWLLWSPTCIVGILAWQQLQVTHPQPPSPAVVPPFIRAASQCSACVPRCPAPREGLWQPGREGSSGTHPGYGKLLTPAAPEYTVQALVGLEHPSGAASSPVTWGLDIIHPAGSEKLHRMVVQVFPRCSCGASHSEESCFPWD